MPGGTSLQNLPTEGDKDWEKPGKGPNFFEVIYCKNSFSRSADGTFF
jgi:hypothetical protein